ncbi:uncharacterized protein I206_104279 [Kwoniella pini CBS 10737]|uniref:F-box domain-containing protein n=1 Tax=Kwoniella pini CBS 10737 TaxID=1296096 RepID=A0A1B9I247_9TREE|nr:uncharacterized protein I206_04145 [Kwoniella pini CBS 10737]OCF49623.1 hypothetical protein I206_04145 [Kwoniella pini CBS 10737]
MTNPLPPLSNTPHSESINNADAEGQSSKITESLDDSMFDNDQDVPPISASDDSDSTHAPPPQQLRVPVEILQKIAQYADQPTLAVFMRVSNITYTIASRHLYRQLILTKNNVQKVFIGFPTPMGYRQHQVPGGFQEVRSIYFPGSVYTPVRSYGPFDSDDEEDSFYQETDPHLPSQTYYPTRQTMQRKYLLLNLTRAITIGTKLPTNFCQNIDGWVSHLSPPTGVLLPRLERLIISSQAIKEWADWRDRNLVMSAVAETQDPHFGFLVMLAAPQYMCIRLPTYTIDDWFAFYRSRTQYYSYLPPKELTQHLFMLFRYLAYSEALLIAKDVCEARPSGRPCTSLHNVTNGRVDIEAPPLNIFFSYLLTHPYIAFNYPNFAGNPVVQNFYTRERKYQIRSYLQLLAEGSYLGNRHINMIVPDAEEETVLEEMREFAKELKLNSDATGKGVDCLIWADAAPCSCCSTREGEL